MSLEDIYTFINTERPPKKRLKSWDSWMLFFKICAYTGLPLKLISKIKKSDIMISKQLIHIPATSEIIPIPATIKTDIIDKIRTTKNGYIFKTLRNKPLSDESWDRAFKSILSASELGEKDYRPMSLQITAQNRIKDVQILLIRDYLQKQTANHNIYKDFKLA